MWPEHLPITALRCCHSQSSGTHNMNEGGMERFASYVKRWRWYISIGLPLSLALALSSCLLFKFLQIPGTLIGFDGHIPGKIASKILLRHPAAAFSEGSVPPVSFGDGPLSISVDVSPIRILLLVSRRAPSQHALIPSKVAKSESGGPTICRVSRRGCRVLGRNSGMIRSRYDPQISDLSVADR